MREPKTLQQAITFFDDKDYAREYAVKMRWPDGVVCPKCGSRDVLYLAKYERWHCRAKHEAPQFTLKTGTVMEDSPIALGKWLMVMWMLVNCRNGISSYEVHRDIGVTQKSAWFMLHRVRLTMQEKLSKMGGPGSEIESDETFVGGKAKNMSAPVTIEAKIEAPKPKEEPKLKTNGAVHAQVSVYKAPEAGTTEGRILSAMRGNVAKEWTPDEVAAAANIARVQTAHFSLGKLAFRRQVFKTNSGAYKVL